MRKRFFALSITVLLSTLMMISGCGGEKAPTGGKGELDLFSLLPDNAAGVFSVNFKKAAQQDFFEKMIQESEKKKAEKPEDFFKNYQDFVTKTGIDPKKDINAMAFGLYGKLAGQEPDPVFLANLTYKKDTLLTILKEKAPEFAEDTYNDIGVYKFKDDKGKDMAFAFLTDNIIAAGKPELLNRVIDLHKGTGKSILADESMKPYLEKLKVDAILSFVFGFPEEAKKVHDSGMFKMDLTKAEAIIGHVDYDNKTWTAEVTMISHNEEANQQLVSTLNGLKMMAGAGGPEFVEVVNNINLTATAESVKLTVTITDELMEKLKAKMGEMMPAQAGQAPPSEGN